MQSLLSYRPRSFAVRENGTAPERPGLGHDHRSASIMPPSFLSRYTPARRLEGGITMLGSGLGFVHGFFFLGFVGLGIF
jgi:hypothetical protein